MTALTRSNSLADLAARINAAHEAAAAALKSSVTHAMQAGELLLEAKEKVDHGEWLPWLKANFPFSDRTARLYMQIYRRREDVEAKMATVADLTVREAVETIANAKPKRPSDFEHWRDWAESFDDIEDWAEATCREPFTDYDFDKERQGYLRQTMWKLATVVGAPAEAVMLLQIGDDFDLPTERALTADLIHRLTMAVAPYAKGDKAVQIDTKNPLEAALTLKLEAQCLIGLMFREIEAREGLSPDELDNRARVVMDEMIESLDAAWDAFQRNKRGETIDCAGRKGKAWDDLRALVAMRDSTARRGAKYCE